MDNIEITRDILERFERRIAKDPYLAKVQKKIEEGTATMVDADIYASRLAECYNMSIGEVLGKASIEEYRAAVDKVLPPGLHQITDRINDRTKEIIDMELQDANIGMKAVSADYDYRKEQEVVGNIHQAAENAEEVSQVEPVASRQIEAFSQKAAMNTIQTNAQAQNNAGLEVRVTRIYDGVGVHMRKDPCEWCLERCGENMSYSEARSKGAFERHPGCHCEIFYKPKRGGWQRQSNWKFNEWEGSQDPQTLKMRQRYGAAESGHRGLNRNAEIARSIIHSPDYGRRLSSVDENRSVTKRIISEARNILDHRNGTLFEDLMFIDTRTGSFITRTDYNGVREVQPNKKMIKMVKDAPEYTIASMHNHPGSTVPSPQDIKSLIGRKNAYGIVVCHDGSIYKYSAKEFAEPIYAAAIAKLDKTEYNSIAIAEFVTEANNAGVTIEVF